MSSGGTRSDLGDRADFYLDIDSGWVLSPSLIASVEELCDNVEDTAADTAVVLRLGGSPNDGGGPGDVGVHLVNKWERALRRLERLAAVTIAVADGDCSGVALEALLSCDYRIGTPGLRLALPVAAGEPWPGMVVHRLANQLGVARARHLVLFGSAITGRRAVELGILDELTEDVDFAVEAQTALARGLAGTELAIRRRLLMDATTTSFEDALGTHLAACDRTLRRASGESAR
ncbi:enoyl-CoA-hydratase DpgB [Umezawaea sp.]|uniref:enoyl-CoA-hydratase DpgB n=1 Tax=Umezawaea sp. TaxID=1955258 RepID=UPI002ED1F9D7